jgi:hypothetical protein
MKSVVKLAGTVAVMLTCAQSILAVPITGGIGFTGEVTYDTTSAGTATQVTSWVAPITVNSHSGSFSAVPLGSVATFASAVWNLDTISVINNFWAVSGFTFNLVSSSITAHGGTPGVNGFVVVSGTGIVTGPAGSGYDPTTLTWNFESSDASMSPGPHWSFTATAPVSVPDGGATVMLLGVALSGLALLKKKLAV